MELRNTQMHLQSRHDYVGSRTCFLLLLLWIAGSAVATENAGSHSPTLAPTCSHDHHHHHHHHHHCNDTTTTPSLAPTRLYPTLAPTVHRNHTPTEAPTHHSTTLAPTPAVVSHPPTAAPSAEPPKTEAPSPSPAIYNITTAPSASPAPPAPVPPRKVSIWRILGKTLGWLILIALSVLLFGAIMTNRYQIYYFLLATGRRIRRLECTRWILQKTGLYRFFGDDGSGGGALNEVIFDRSDLTEGLLMTGEDQS